MKPYKVWRQYILPHHPISRFMGWFTTRPWPWLKNWQIRTFIKKYDVDMSIAEFSEPSDYPDFTHFFVRRLKPSARPIASGERDIISPVDGTVAQMGSIDGARLLQAKKHFFHLEELLGGDFARADIFRDGLFTTLYLSPRDYHRVHMPIQGRLLDMRYVPGRLFSVNLHTSAHVPQLFARNERIICTFETPVGPMAIVFVGAMFVASMVTKWAGIVTPHKKNEVYLETYQDREPIDFHPGDEIGHFNFGSTVIVLFPKTKIQWLDSLKVGDQLCMGQRIAYWQ